MKNRNKSKLSWNEMNVKQRIFYVLDWIMRGVLIVTLALFIVALGMNCAGYGSDDDSAAPSSVAYADDVTNSNRLIDGSSFAQYNLNLVNDRLYFPVPFPELSTLFQFPISLSAGDYTIFVSVGNGDIVLNSCDYYFANSSFVKCFSISSSVLNSPNHVVSFSLTSSQASEISFLCVYFNSSASFFSGQVVNYIMLVKGLYDSDSMPAYQPNLQYIYESGYDFGHSLGIEQGREEGVNSVPSAQAGIFYNSTLSADVTYFDNEASSEYTQSFSDFTPNLGYNSVLFNSFYNYIFSQRRNQNTYPESVECTIDLYQPFSYNAERPFYISGSSRSDIFSITLIDINGKRYSGHFDSDRDYFAFFESSEGLENAAAISSIELYFGRAEDTMQDAALSQDSGGYFQGYNSGLSQGLNEGYLNGLDAGYDNGYEVGYESGFSAADGGGFAWLISSVQTFLNEPFFGSFGIGTLLYVALGIVFVSLFLKFFAGG